jgi:hypothetical protein
MMPASVRSMETIRVLAKVNPNDLRSAVSARAYSYWFSFSYVYYGSPAVLVEQEVRRP